MMIHKLVDSKPREGKKNSGKAWLLAMNFSEFCDILEDYDGGEQASNQTFHKRFHGDREFGNNLDASKKLIWKGYEPKEMKNAFEGFETAFEATSTMVKMDIEGHDFDVAAILSGEEETWFKNAPKGSAPSIHIVFSGSANAGVSSMNFYIQAAVVARITEELEQEAIIKVSASYSAVNCLRDSKASALGILLAVKDFDEPSNKKRLGGVAHPSFFRRNVFSLMENPNGVLYSDKDTCPKDGYGQSVESVISDEDMSESFGSDFTIRIPSPSSEHFDNIENAVMYCKSVLKDIQAKVSK